MCTELLHLERARAQFAWTAVLGRVLSMWIVGPVASLP